MLSKMISRVKVLYKDFECAVVDEEDTNRMVCAQDRCETGLQYVGSTVPAGC